MSDEYVEIEVDAVMRETAKAILFAIDDERVWIPKSVIDEEQSDFDSSIFVAEWFAEKAGLI